ncbi:MAG: condensation domain-containing protein [Novosphingobium sp.]
MMVDLEATSLQRLVHSATRRNSRAGWHSHAFTLRGMFANPDTLNASFARIFDQFPILNSSFRSATGSGLRIDIPERPVVDPLGFEELGPLEDDAVRAQLADYAMEPLEIGSGPLFKARLLHCGDELVCLVRAHHIVSDAMSRRLIFNAMVGLGAAQQGTPLASAVEAQTKHLNWERDFSDQPYAAERVAEVRAMLGRNEALPAEAEVREAPHPGLTMGSVKALDVDDTARLQQLARSHRTSGFAMVCAAYSSALATISGGDGHLITLQYSTRMRVGLPNAVGNFIDYLPIEVSAHGDLAERGFDVGRSMQRALRHFIPIKVLSERLGIEEHRPNPLLLLTCNQQPPDNSALNVFLSLPDELDNTAAGDLAPLGLPIRTITLEMQDAGLIVGEYRGRLRWRLTARADIVPAHAIEQLSEAIGASLRSALQPDGG